MRTLLNNAFLVPRKEGKTLECKYKALNSLTFLWVCASHTGDTLSPSEAIAQKEPPLGLLLGEGSRVVELSSWMLACARCLYTVDRRRSVFYPTYTL